MNNLQLDCALAYLNEGRAIDPISLLVESIENEINNFNIITEDTSVINEGKIFDKIKEVLTRIANAIKTAIKNIGEKIRSFFNRSKIEEEVVIKKAKSIEDVAKEKFETPEAQKAIEDLQDRMRKFADNLAKKEEDAKIKSDDIKKGSKDLYILEWHFTSTDIDRVVNNIEEDLEILKKYITTGTLDRPLNREGSVNFRNEFKFKPINIDNFIDESNIKNQFNSINKYYSELEATIKKAEALPKKIEEIAQMNADSSDEERKFKGEITPYLSALSSDVSGYIKALNEISENAIKAKRMATQNYNIILNLFD